MATRKYNRNKRPGSKPVQTKRTAKNARNWAKRTGYAIRMLNRSKYFRAKEVIIVSRHADRALLSVGTSSR